MCLVAPFALKSAGGRTQSGFAGHRSIVPYRILAEETEASHMKSLLSAAEVAVC